MAVTFKKAKRGLSKLRLALSGVSGSGKTYSALLLAKGLGGRIAVIDTERGSASLYADMPGIPEFDVLELEAPFSPERYVEAIRAAEDAGYDVLIIDSMTHEWTGKGGCLELVEEIAKARFRGNTWSAWSELTPRHRDFVDAILTSKLHVIATIRSKTETAQEEKNGRKIVQKLGMKTEQRDGTDYEFTVMFDITHDGHFAVPSKDRTGLFMSEKNPFVISEETGKRIKGWLESSGVTPEQFADLMTRTLEADSLDVLAQIGKKIASFGLCNEDRDKIKEAYKTRRAELMREASNEKEEGNGQCE